MASSYEISARDLHRLVAMLQRQPLGTLYRDGRLRVVETHNGSYTVTDVEFRPIERAE